MLFLLWSFLSWPLTRRKKEVHSLTTLAIDLGLHGSWQIFFLFAAFRLYSDNLLQVQLYSDIQVWLYSDNLLQVAWRKLSEYNRNVANKNFCQLPWSPRSIANVVYAIDGNMTLKESKSSSAEVYDINYEISMRNGVKKWTVFFSGPLGRKKKEVHSLTLTMKSVWEIGQEMNLFLPSFPECYQVFSHSGGLWQKAERGPGTEARINSSC